MKKVNSQVETVRLWLKTDKWANDTTALFLRSRSKDQAAKQMLTYFNDMGTYTVPNTNVRLSWTKLRAALKHFERQT